MVMQVTMEWNDKAKAYLLLEADEKNAIKIAMERTDNEYACVGP
jgi:hypothetical protein